MSFYNSHWKTLFIHIPKTGGTSMEKREFIGGGGHEPIWSFRRFFNASDLNWDNVFKFAFVRDPQDRLVSAYFHEKFLVRGERSISGFRNFVKGLRNKDMAYNYSWTENKYPLHTHFLPQVFFISNQQKQVLVDYIGRFSHLTEDWDFICRKLGVSNDLLHLRTGKHKPFLEYYDKETTDIVRRIYAEDYQILERYFK